MDERWAASGSGGKLRMPKVSTDWVGTFIRKSLAGGSWSVVLRNEEGVTPASGHFALDPITLTLTPELKDGVLTLRLATSCPSAKEVDFGICPRGLPEVKVELLDDAGRLIDTWEMKPYLPGVRRASGRRPAAAVKGRVMVDFGLFKVLPAEVAMPR